MKPYRLYPIDKTRVNEYGQSFEDEEPAEGKTKLKESKKTK